jgi:predicted nucleic acid-binding protein
MAAVVADTSPLIALHQLGQLRLLENLFVEVFVPPAVAHEAAPSLSELPGFIRTQVPAQPLPPQLEKASLGPGESQALGLALELHADLVILDERPGRRLAVALGLNVAGTAGILLRAKHAGFVPAVRPFLEELRRLEFHLSEAIVDQILADAGEAQR